MVINDCRSTSNPCSRGSASCLLPPGLYIKTFIDQVNMIGFTTKALRGENSRAQKVFAVKLEPHRLRAEAESE
jgi:hypothetical protein